MELSDFEQEEIRHLNTDIPFRRLYCISFNLFCTNKDLVEVIPILRKLSGNKLLELGFKLVLKDGHCAVVWEKPHENNEKKGV
jgi:hypothetical protein